MYGIDKMFFHLLTIYSIIIRGLNKIHLILFISFKKVFEQIISIRRQFSTAQANKFL